MKTWTVVARLNSNGTKVTTKVQADSADEAELIAGRKFLEYGFKGDAIKIVSID